MILVNHYAIWSWIPKTVFIKRCRLKNLSFSFVLFHWNQFFLDFCCLCREQLSAALYLLKHLLLPYRVHFRMNDEWPTDQRWINNDRFWPTIPFQWNTYESATHCSHRWVWGDGHGQPAIFQNFELRTGQWWMMDFVYLSAWIVIDRQDVTVQNKSLRRGHCILNCQIPKDSVLKDQKELYCNNHQKRFVKRCPAPPPYVSAPFSPTQGALDFVCREWPWKCNLSFFALLWSCLLTLLNWISCSPTQKKPGLYQAIDHIQRHTHTNIHVYRI